MRSFLSSSDDIVVPADEDVSPSRRASWPRQQGGGVLLGLGGGGGVGVAAPRRATWRSGAYSESICLKEFCVAPQRGRPASRTTLFRVSWRFQTPEKRGGGRMHLRRSDAVWRARRRGVWPCQHVSFPSGPCVEPWGSDWLYSAVWLTLSNCVLAVVRCLLSHAVGVVPVPQ